MKFYKHATKQGFLSFVEYINNSSFMPLTGQVAGKPAPEENAKTTMYLHPEAAQEFADGSGWGGPKIRDAVLDYAGVDQATREQILSTYEISIVDIDPKVDLVHEILEEM